MEFVQRRISGIIVHKCGIYKSYKIMLNGKIAGALEKLRTALRKIKKSVAFFLPFAKVFCISNGGATETMMVDVIASGSSKTFF